MSAVQDEVTPVQNWDVELGNAARLLHHRGYNDAVLLLLAVKDVSIEFWEEDWGVSSFRYYFQVELSVIDDLTPDVENQIRDALNAVLKMSKEACHDIVLVPALAGGDWRSELKGAIYGKPVNQASLAPLPQRYPTKDRMRFRDGGEVAVYDAFIRAQQRLSTSDTLTVVCNPAVRVNGHTWEPDFLIAFGGKCGIVEVDGSTHSNRWAADKSKDAIYEDSGIAYIARIPVEDTSDPATLDLFVDRFLKRLLG